MIVTAGGPNSPIRILLPITRQILSFNRKSSSPVEIRICELLEDVLAVIGIPTMNDMYPGPTR